MSNNKTVANCHKYPQSHFNKSLLSENTITNSLNAIVQAIMAVNSTISIIFTVSPVRHIKDGFVENMQSKAHLISAVHKIIGHKVSYFPAFEIMMDELRDYRFYKPDMLHPNSVAVDYIWQKFQEVWLSAKAIKILNRVAEVQKGLQHRPFQPKSEAHQKFLKQLELKQKALQLEFKHITF